MSQAGSGLGMLAPSALPGSPPPPVNLTEIRTLLEKLTPEQYEALFKELEALGLPTGTGHPGERLVEWLNSDPEMHVRSYEQDLMQYEEFRVHKILLLYVPPILIILGTFGNIFSFIILKRKAMLKFSTYFYLMVLAIADTLVLYIGLLRLWIGELTGFDLRDQADWICKLTNVIGYTVSDFSVWLIIAVTIERYIVVCHPLKANTMCNTPRARKVILGLLAGLFLLNLHFFWTVKIMYFKHNNERIPQCGSADEHSRLVEEIWPWMDAFIYSFLPFVAIMALNGLIIRQVVLARRHRNELRPGGGMYEQRRPSHEGSTRLTIMLLTISFAFLLTTLPMNITSILADFFNIYKNDLRMVAKFSLARTITELLMYVNHSMNFFLYCATGQKFRHQLVWMICYAKRTYNLTFVSEGPSAATRLESLRNGKSRKSTADVTELCACTINNTTSKSEIFIPLRCGIDNQKSV